MQSQGWPNLAEIRSRQLSYSKEETDVYCMCVFERCCVFQYLSIDLRVDALDMSSVDQSTSHILTEGGIVY